MSEEIRDYVKGRIKALEGHKDSGIAQEEIAQAFIKGKIRAYEEMLNHLDTYVSP